MKKLLLMAVSLGIMQCNGPSIIDFLSGWKRTSDRGDRGENKPQAIDSLVALSTRDVHLDHEDKNTGLGSEVRLAYADAVALVAFDTMPAVPPGRKLFRAELSLRGWTDAEGRAEVTLDLFNTSLEWTEGTGHWYFHTGGPKNGYHEVYSLFPEYTPPAVTTDPKDPSGITWTRAAALRADMVKITTASAVLLQNQPKYCYPRLEFTGTIAFDLTAYLSDPLRQGKPISFGIRQAPPEAGPNRGFAWIYARNHVNPAVYGPRLTLWYR